jgi:hypothetical protein
MAVALRKIKKLTVIMQSSATAKQVAACSVNTSLTATFFWCDQCAVLLSTEAVPSYTHSYLRCISSVLLELKIFKECFTKINKQLLQHVGRTNFFEFKFF